MEYPDNETVIQWNFHTMEQPYGGTVIQLTERHNPTTDTNVKVNLVSKELHEIS